MREQEYSFMYSLEENHWWFVGMRSIVLSLLPQTSIPPSPRTLDAGCGTGYNLVWFRKQYGSQVYGLDYYPYGLHFCRERGETNLVQGTVACLPFPNDSFDLVLCLDVLQQLSDPDSRAHTLAEFLRVLRPGGSMVIRVAAFEWLRSSHDTEVLTQHRFELRELRNLVNGVGFLTERFTFANAFLFPVAVAWRGLKKLRLVPGGSDVRPTTRGPEWLNQVMASLLQLEAAILRKTRFSFPAGLSIVAVARKPAGSNSRHSRR